MIVIDDHSLIFLQGSVLAIKKLSLHFRTCRLALLVSVLPMKAALLTQYSCCPATFCDGTNHCGTPELQLSATNHLGTKGAQICRQPHTIMMQPLPAATMQCRCLIVSQRMYPALPFLL